VRLGRLATVLVLFGALLLAATPSARAAVNDPGLGQQWALPMVGAPDAWATGTGLGITIAVVDTGVHFGHEDLTGKVLPGRNFVSPGASAQDDNGHGTHVAGIAAAVTNNGRGIAGVAPDAKILPVKVLNAEGTGGGSVVDGIRWAADQGVAVINLSLGDQEQGNYTAILGPSFGDAIEYAWSKGAICVVSAGNVQNTEYEFVTSPNFGSHNAIVVTSLNKAGAKPDLARPTRSAKWGMAAPGGDPAPGVRSEDHVLSAWFEPGKNNSYAYAAGTSMAAPHVAGAAAVLRGLGLSKQATVDRLLATARDVGPAGDDSIYGHGALDLRAAVAGLKPVGPGSTATAPNESPGATSPPPVKGKTTPTSGRPGSPGASTGANAGEGVTPVDGGDLAPAGEERSGGDAGASDDEESAAGTGAGSDTDDGRPWAAAAVALLTLLGALALLTGVVRPKPT
jgi:subtilisin family serine protease